MINNLPLIDEWYSMDDDVFNEWRRKNDFPRVISFLFEALPNFKQWTDEQQITDELMFFGPAKFLEPDVAFLYSYEIEHANLFNSTTVSERICSKHKLSNEKFVKIKNEKKITTYFNWLSKSKLPDYLDVISNFTVNKKTANSSKDKYSKNYIALNIPLHIPRKRKLDFQNQTKTPEIELLKLGGGDKIIDEAIIGNKILDFTDLSNLQLEEPIITNDQSFLFCCLDNLVLKRTTLLRVEMKNCSTKNLIVDNVAILNSVLLNCTGTIQINDAKIKDSSYKNKSFQIAQDKSTSQNLSLEYFSYRKNHANEEHFYKEAKLLYSSLGHTELAGNYYYKERCAQTNKIKQDILSSKIKIWSKVRTFPKLIQYMIEKFYWGFGEKPQYIILSSLFVISSFSVYCYAKQNSITHDQVFMSLIYSLQSYTNIKVVDNLNQIDRVINFIATCFSYLGLISTGMLVASIAAKTKKYS